MTKFIPIIWPFVHACLGFLVVGSFGHMIFDLRVPFDHDACIFGPTLFTNTWPTEYAFMALLSGLPGVLYAAAVASAAKSKRRAASILFTAFALVTAIIVFAAIQSRFTGITTGPSLSPAAAIVTLGAMFAVGLGATLLAHGRTRRNRLISASLLLVISFGVVLILPEAAIACHKASLHRIRARLPSLNPDSNAHFLLRVRHAEDKHALVQLGYLEILDFIPRDGMTGAQMSNLWEEIRSNIGDVACVDADWTVVGSEWGTGPGGPSKDTPMFRIWDRPARADFWARTSEKHGMGVYRPEAKRYSPRSER